MTKYQIIELRRGHLGRKKVVRFCVFFDMKDHKTNIPRVPGMGLLFPG